jgi:hypothetical protein
LSVEPYRLSHGLQSSAPLPRANHRPDEQHAIIAVSAIAAALLADPH